MKRHFQDDITNLLNQLDQPGTASSPEEARIEVELESTNGVPTVHVYLFDEDESEEEHNTLVEGSITNERSIADEVQPQFLRYPRWMDLLLVVGSMLVLATSTLIPILTSIAVSPVTVIIQPTMKTVELTTPLTLPGRELPPLRLAQSKTVKATGKGYQEARSASGTITLYNALPTPQYVEAGTILTSASGVEIVLDQGVTIPAGDGATNGQITVTAHTLMTGNAANIEAYDINGPCCIPYILAKNPAPFSGGQDTRSFAIVTKEDITKAVNDLQPHLLNSTEAVFTSQARQGEAITNPVCTPKTDANHKAGDEAQKVTITVEMTCTASTYSKGELQALAKEKVNQEAQKQLGTRFLLFGDVHFSIVKNDLQRGQAILTIKASGSYGYQFTQQELDRLKAGIVGKSQKEATTWLKNQPGVWLVVIDQERLPTHVGSLEIAIFCTRM